MCKLSMFSHGAFVYVSMTITAAFVYCQKRFESELVCVGV